MKNILITGGTGLVGSHLANYLKSLNYNIAVLSRQRNSGADKSFYWDYEKGEMDAEAIDFADIIIHLVGENVSAKKWTSEQKKRIVDSRTKTTELLFRTIESRQKKLDAFISASAVGYYGNKTTESIFAESDLPGHDFLAQTVVDWEKAVKKIASLSIPVTILRLGVVMSSQGGALPKMLAPVKLGLGAALGTGKQWVPWIHLDDLSRMFGFVLENSLKSNHPQGVKIYNAVAPTHINNGDLMRQLAKLTGKPFFFPPVPAFVFRFIYGEMADILLQGSRVSAHKILDEGFVFNIDKIQKIPL